MRLLLATGRGGSFAAPAPPGADLERWAEAYASPPTVITCIGDSISAAWGIAGGLQWPTLLDGLFGTDVATDAYASPGQPSAYFTDPAHYSMDNEPALVVVELGVNDMATSVTKAAYKANIEELVTELRGELDPDPSVLLLIVYEIGDTYPTAWSEYADALTELAGELDDVTTYDLRPAFGAPTTTLLQSDLVHPNEDGHELIANLLYAFLT